MARFGGGTRVVNSATPHLIQLLSRFSRVAPTRALDYLIGVAT
jgi:hypothetical protein